MKLQQLVAALQGVEAFRSPDFRLEQYSTGVEVAAHSLFEIQSHFGDIEGKLVADVGCGTGILGIGCSLLGAA
jgi:rRNA N6-adenosine-methyltransferase METTL5